MSTDKFLSRPQPGVATAVWFLIGCGAPGVSCTSQAGIDDGRTSAPGATSDGEPTDSESSSSGAESDGDGSGASGGSGDTDGSGGGGDTNGDSGNGSDGTGGVTDESCGYGVGPDDLTHSFRVSNPADHLLTDASRPDTAEVYCVPASSGDSSRQAILVPGLGLNHSIYLATPDGRDGWGPLFAQADVTAHLVDPVRNVTSADDPSAADGLNMWEEIDFWSRWGFGPDAPREPYPDGRFPVEAADAFIERLPQYGPGPGGTGVSPSAVAELTELLEQVGPAVLIAHSAAGPAAFEVAATRPELLDALVVVEPTGCPTDVAPPVPFLAVYGDYIGPRGQTGRQSACQTTRDLVDAAGHPAAFISYPERGVMGNSHLLMQDDNADEIAGDIADWLMDQVWN